MADAHGQKPAPSSRHHRWRAIVRSLDWLSAFFVAYMYFGGLIRSHLPDRAQSEDSWYGCRLTNGWFNISVHCPDSGWGRIVEFWVESTFAIGLYPFGLLSGNMLSGNHPWYQIAPAAAFALVQIFLMIWLVGLLVRLVLRGLAMGLRKLRA